MEAVRPEIPETYRNSFRKDRICVISFPVAGLPGQGAAMSEEKERGMRFAHFVSIQKNGANFFI